MHGHAQLRDDPAQNPLDRLRGLGCRTKKRQGNRAQRRTGGDRLGDVQPRANPSRRDESLRRRYGLRLEQRRSRGNPPLHQRVTHRIVPTNPRLDARPRRSPSPRHVEGGKATTRKARDRPGVQTMAHLLHDQWSAHRARERSNPLHQSLEVSVAAHLHGLLERVEVKGKCIRLHEIDRLPKLRRSIAEIELRHAKVPKQRHVRSEPPHRKRGHQLGAFEHHALRPQHHPHAHPLRSHCEVLVQRPRERSAARHGTDEQGSRQWPSQERRRRIDVRERGLRQGSVGEVDPLEAGGSGAKRDVGLEARFEVTSLPGGIVLLHASTVPRGRYPFRMRLVPVLLAGLLALAGCSAPGVQGPFDPAPHDPSDVAAVLARCDLSGSEDVEAMRKASNALLDAIEAGTVATTGGGLLVGFRRDSTSVAQASTLVAGAASARILRTPMADTLHLEVARDADPIALARTLLEDPSVAFAHPDVRLEPASVPDDPLWSVQWNLADFGVPQAWTVERGRDTVTIAVIDDGIDVDHPDFAGRIVAGWDLHDGDDDPASDVGHGSHVAAIAAANGFDGIGVSGVAPSAVRILPIKVFDDAGRDTGGSITASAERVAKALTWASGAPVAGLPTLAAPANIANLSLVVNGAYTSIPVLDRAIRDARARGTLVLAAAGNAFSNNADRGILAPANAPCALAIGSIDHDLDRSYFSHYASSGRSVDLVAPGGRTTGGDGITSALGEGTWGQQVGTSMAAPFVSGVAALMLSNDPTLTTEDLIAKLLQNASRPTGETPAELGFGVPCPDAMLDLATGCGYPRNRR